MNTARAARLTAAAGAAAALVTGTLIWSSSGGAAQAGHGARHAAPAQAAAARASAPGTGALPASCQRANPVIGYVGVPRSGRAAEARQALGRALLAQAGGVDLARPAGGFSYPNGPVPVRGLSNAQRSALFTRWLPVRALPRQRDLRSCLYLMTDAPKAQPLISAAKVALVRAGYFASAARLNAVLQEVRITDDPAAGNSVIVTVVATGRAYRPAVKGAPTLHRAAPYTVIMNPSAAQVTGVAAGGF